MFLIALLEMLIKLTFYNKYYGQYDFFIILGIPLDFLAIYCLVHTNLEYAAI